MLEVTSSLVCLSFSCHCHLEKAPKLNSESAPRPSTPNLRVKFRMTLNQPPPLNLPSGIAITNQLGNRFTPQEQLAKFAKSALPHLLERVADVDPRVAGAAVRCLKQTELTEILKEIGILLPGCRWQMMMV